MEWPPGLPSRPLASSTSWLFDSARSEDSKQRPLLEGLVAMVRYWHGVSRRRVLPDEVASFRVVVDVPRSLEVFFDFPWRKRLHANTTSLRARPAASFSMAIST